MKLDILVIAAHPDDAELTCSGTIMSHIAQGKKVGIIDLTRGEMGTRGTPETRAKESAVASSIMGLSARENLGFEDIFFANDRNHQMALVKMIRKYQPDILIGNAISDRHPDHGKAGSLTTVASFMAGLAKVETNLDDQCQKAWRPAAVYHYIQSNYLKPDFVVDISAFWKRKMEAIRAFKSQFFDPNSKEPETFVSSPEFMKMIEARAKEYGHSIGVEYGEGFTVERNIGIKNMFDLL